MTSKEAIRKLKNIFSDILPMGYEEPEELLLAIQALEKQVAMKGIPYNSAKNHEFIECPSCHKNMGLYYRHCPNCGQAIDWGSENDE